MGDLIDMALARQDARAASRKPIDYDRMNKVLPRQKAELTRIAKTRDAEQIAAVVKRHIAVWDEIGAWPDCWARWQVTLNDALPWNQAIDIENL
jgi:hypothetical protein